MGVRPVSAPGSPPRRRWPMAVGANRIGYGEYSHRQWPASRRLTVEDPQARRIAQGPIEAAADASDVVGAATAIARQISTDAQPYGTRNVAALEAYAKAIESSDAAAIGAFCRAGDRRRSELRDAYCDARGAEGNQQDRAGATAVLEAARPRGTRDPADRSHPPGDPGGRPCEETAPARTAPYGAGAGPPADPAAWRSLAEASTAAAISAGCAGLPAGAGHRAGGREHLESTRLYRRLCRQSDAR